MAQDKVVADKNKTSQKAVEGLTGQFAIAPH